MPEAATQLSPPSCFRMIPYLQYVLYVSTAAVEQEDVYESYCRKLDVTLFFCARTAVFFRHLHVLLQKKTIPERVFQGAKLGL